MISIYLSSNTTSNTIRKQDAVNRKRILKIIFFAKSPCNGNRRKWKKCIGSWVVSLIKYLTFFHWFLSTFFLLIPANFPTWLFTDSPSISQQACVKRGIIVKIFILILIQLVKSFGSILMASIHSCCKPIQLSCSYAFEIK